MASITIRNLDEGVKKRLRLRAAENGRSMEEEARAILDAKMGRPAVEETGANLFDRIHARFAPFGGLELKLPSRKGRKVPNFK